MVQFGKIRGLGLRDPGSNPGIPILLKWLQNQKKQNHQEDSEQDMEKQLGIN